MARFHSNKVPSWLYKKSFAHLEYQFNSQSIPLLSLQQHPHLKPSRKGIMKTTTTITSLVILLGAAVDSVSAAACYGVGADFINKNDAIYHIGRACNGYDGKKGAFQGNFVPGEAKYVCVNGPGNQRYDMLVQNLNTGKGYNLADNDCALRLGIIVNDCLRGGEDTVAGWSFRWVNLAIVDCLSQLTTLI
jgi:hypothetical protein